MPRLARTITGAVILLTVLVTPVRSEEFTFDYQKIIDLEGPVRLDVRLMRGSVEVVGSEDHRIIIEAVKRVRASSYDEAQEVSDHMEIKTRQNGSVVEVRTNYLRISTRDRSFWQKLFGSGEDALGDVQYRISAPVRTDVKISGLASTISVGSIEGVVDVENESGQTRAEYIFGPVTVSQPHGDVDLQWIEGDIRVKATTGTIAVNQVRGALDIATHTGEVHVRTELDSPRDYFVETTSGRITFAIPPAASGRFKVETASGGIQSEVPLVIESVTRRQLIGTFGRGGPRIHLTTSSGDVTVAQF